MDAILSHVDRRYFPDPSRLRRALFEVREQFSRLRLDLYVNQEIASERHVILEVQWNREQTSTATGTPTVVRGLAEWQFSRDRGLLMDLRPVLGGPPLGFD